MTTIFSPCNIEVLLLCFMSPDPIPRIEVPAVREAIHDLLKVGAIAPESKRGVYKTTPLGDAWVQALCNVPPPKQVFVDEQGRVL